MGKLIEEGEFEAEGMTFHYKYYRDGRIPNSKGYNCYIECYYDSKIVVYDYGAGLDRAIDRAKLEIAIRKKNAEKARKEGKE